MDDKTTPDKKVLFLDIDGVMNATGHGRITDWQEEAVETLRRILQNTGAEVVISSSWRMDQLDTFADTVEKVGLKDLLDGRVLGTTPVLEEGDLPTREDEIGCWLFENNYHGRMVILDDEEVLGDLSPWHVHVNGECGLRLGAAEKAIWLLNEGTPYYESTSQA